MESVKVKAFEGNNTREILEEIEILSTELTECDKYMKCVQHVIKPIMVKGNYFNRIFVGKKHDSNEYQIDLLYKTNNEIIDELSLDSITQGVEFRICKQMLN